MDREAVGSVREMKDAAETEGARRATGVSAGAAGAPDPEGAAKAKRRRFPFSESHFRTLKYRPEFPERFALLERARHLCRTLFNWYNTEHHHSGLAFLTPARVHDGRADEILEARHRVRLAA